jgi:NADH dehydrogenase
MLERAGALGPELGPGPRPAITAALDELGVERRLGTCLSAVTEQGAELSDGTTVPARTVVWTAGVRASRLTEDVPAERDGFGRLLTDRFLRVPGVPGVYAAGDTAAAEAEDGHRTMPSCQHALQLGRFAGHNVAADLLGLPPVPFAPDPYVTCLDLGPAGAVFTTGWERRVQSTGETAKARKRAVNQEWIYPPTDDADEILRRADYRVSTRRPVKARSA